MSDTSPTPADSPVPVEDVTVPAISPDTQVITEDDVVVHDFNADGAQTEGGVSL